MTGTAAAGLDIAAEATGLTFELQAAAKAPGAAPAAFAHVKGTSRPASLQNRLQVSTVRGERGLLAPEPYQTSGWHSQSTRGTITAKRTFAAASRASGNEIALYRDLTTGRRSSRPSSARWAGISPRMCD